MAEGEQTEASFNMAVATLQRIHLCLETMRLIFFNYPPSITRQRVHIDMVKMFYQNAVPLLKEAKVDTKEYEKEIAQLSLSSRINKGRKELYYDFKKEQRCLAIVAELENKLSPYFMPKRREEDDDDY